METCSPASQVGAESGTGNLEGWLQAGWEPGLGMYLDGRKLCFTQLDVPTGPGLERVQERNKEGQAGHLGHNQLIK